MHRALNIKTITDYGIVGGLIAVSGFPYFMIAQIHFLFLFLLVVFLYLKRSIVFDPRILTIVVIFLIVEILQFLFIKPFDPIMISGTFIRMLLGTFIIGITGKQYIKYYVNILYFFSLVSFVFFLSSLAIPGFFNFCVNTICPFFTPPANEQDSFYVVWPTNILFCFHECVLSDFRNPGPFWEPGLFSVFLIFALLLNLITEKKIGTRKNIVFIIAVLSTFSTSGYIALFILIFSFYFIKINFLKKIVLTVIGVPLVLVLYYSLDFLNSKVERNIELASTTTSSRFGSAIADYNDFSTSPFIGWGRGTMRYGGRQYAFFSEEQHRNNSVTDLLATYGIFIFLFYFYNYYISLTSLCKYNNFNTSFAIFGMLVILVLGFSQSIFLKPFFYSMLFLQYNYKNEESKNGSQQLLSN